MLNSMFFEQFCSDIGLDYKARSTQFRVQSLSGGDIHQSFRLTDTSTECDYFVKAGRADYAKLFAAEQQSLMAIAATDTLLTPGVLALGTTGNMAYLVLSYLPLQITGDEAALGRLLARMHRKQGLDDYGFYEDNYIGLTLQLNRRTDNWSDFWINQRMLPQLNRAREQGLDVDTQRLLAVMADLLSGHNPSPSLLHGDLWGGNKGFIDDGTPVVFDPACYYGDREADIAFTRLFGGFSSGFYEAYQKEWPLPVGFKSREGLYNLYHLLNHFNLFGHGYLSACEREIEAVLSSVAIG